VYEDRVLRRIFGPRRVDVMGGRRKVHNEELHNLYASQNIKSNQGGWDGKGREGHVVCMGEMGNGYKILVRKPEGKMPLGVPRPKSENNIRMDLKKNRVGSCGLGSSGS
jgi:hypothetical protein